MRQKNNVSGPRPTGSLLSPIRTLTVGPGITPDLLTFEFAPKALAGFQHSADLPPVGNFAPP